VQKNPINRQAITTKEDPRCPLSFRLGTTHSTHLSSSHHPNVGTHTPPIIYPLHPDFDAGSGRQILLTTDYEVLEMFTPNNVGTSFDFQTNRFDGQSSEQLKEDEQFPLLFESSSFYHSHPIVHDVEGDGVADAILGDYDGDLHFIGLDFESPNHDSSGGANNHVRRRRYYKRISLPRLFVRKSWYEVAINKTKEDENMALVDENEAAKKNHTKWEEFEPYHTYFAGISDTAWRGPHDEDALRGVSGDVLNMNVESSRKLAQREKMVAENAVDGAVAGDEAHRRLDEDAAAAAQPSQNEDLPKSENEVLPEEVVEARHMIDEYMYEEEPELFGGDDSMDAPPDGSDGSNHEPNVGDDYFPNQREDIEETGESGMEGVDDYYARHRYGYHDDMYNPEPPDGYESYQQYQEIQNKYYHDSNYLRLPPHLLSTCTLAEFPRQYSTGASNPIDRIDEVLLCAVSYYFDEDECKDPSKSGGKSFGKHANADGGDETEEQRGRYVANALMGYNLRWKYWSVQEVLDLSTDWSAPLGDIVKGGTAPITSNAYNGMGAFALASPVTANLDGGDKHHILVGTSMGLVYAIELSYHNSRNGWPVQMRHPVEQRVVVEDVVGNTNLEVFIVDTGGDVVALDADGEVLWARNLLTDDEANLDQDEIYVVRGTSPMSLGGKTTFLIKEEECCDV
jgi:hypothetical protein